MRPIADMCRLRIRHRNTLCKLLRGEGGKSAVSTVLVALYAVWVSVLPIHSHDTVACRWTMDNGKTKALGSNEQGAYKYFLLRRTYNGRIW